MDEEVASQPVQTFVREFEEPQPSRSECRGEWRGAASLPTDTAVYSVSGAGELRAGDSAGVGEGAESVAYRPGGSLNSGVWVKSQTPAQKVITPTSTPNIAGHFGVSSHLPHLPSACFQ